MSGDPAKPVRRPTKTRPEIIRGIPTVRVNVCNVETPKRQALPGQQHLLYPDDVNTQFAEADPAGGVRYPTEEEIEEAVKSRKRNKTHTAIDPHSDSHEDLPNDFLIDDNLIWKPPENWTPHAIEQRLWVRWTIGASLLALTIDPEMNPFGYCLREVTRIIHTVDELLKKTMPISVADFRMKRLNGYMKASDECWTEWERSKLDKIETIVNSDGTSSTKTSGQTGNVAYLKQWKEFQESIAELIESITESSGDNGKLIPSGLGKTREEFQVEVSQRLIQYFQRRIESVSDEKST